MSVAKWVRTVRNTDVSVEALVAGVVLLTAHCVSRDCGGEVVLQGLGPAIDRVVLALKVLLRSKDTPVVQKVAVPWCVLVLRSGSTEQVQKFGTLICVPLLESMLWVEDVETATTCVGIVHSMLEKGIGRKVATRMKVLQVLRGWKEKKRKSDEEAKNIERIIGTLLLCLMNLRGLEHEHREDWSIVIKCAIGRTGRGVRSLCLQLLATILPNSFNQTTTLTTFPSQPLLRTAIMVSCADSSLPPSSQAHLLTILHHILNTNPTILIGDIENTREEEEEEGEDAEGEEDESSAEAGEEGRERRRDEEEESEEHSAGRVGDESSPPPEADSSEEGKRKGVKKEERVIGVAVATAASAVRVAFEMIMARILRDQEEARKGGEGEEEESSEEGREREAPTAPPHPTPLLPQPSSPTTLPPLVDYDAEIDGTGIDEGEEDAKEASREEDEEIPESDGAGPHENESDNKDTEGAMPPRPDEDEPDDWIRVAILGIMVIDSVQTSLVSLSSSSGTFPLLTPETLLLIRSSLVRCVLHGVEFLKNFERSRVTGTSDSAEAGHDDEISGVTLAASSSAPSYSGLQRAVAKMVSRGLASQPEVLWEMVGEDVGVLTERCWEKKGGVEELLLWVLAFPHLTIDPVSLSSLLHHKLLRICVSWLSAALRTYQILSMDETLRAREEKGAEKKSLEGDDNAVPLEAGICAAVTTLLNVLLREEEGDEEESGGTEGGDVVKLERELREVVALELEELGDEKLSEFVRDCLVFAENHCGSLVGVHVGAIGVEMCFRSSSYLARSSVSHVAGAINTVMAPITAGGGEGGEGEGGEEDEGGKLSSLVSQSAAAAEDLKHLVSDILEGAAHAPADSHEAGLLRRLSSTVEDVK